MNASDEQVDGLRFERVSITLGDRQLLSVDRRIAPGEILTIMGPSGSGKSTLLAFAAGFLEPAFRAEGRVILNGEDVTDLPAEKRGLGLLFQDALLFPHMSVGENLMFGLRPSLRGHAARASAVQQALADVGLDDFGDRDPATLSGGQKTRIALMRTLLSEPHALLLDEPFSKLDVERRGKTRSLVFAEAVKRNLPVLLVTHDPADAEAAAGPCIELGGFSET